MAEMDDKGVKIKVKFGEGGEEEMAPEGMSPEEHGMHMEDMIAGIKAAKEALDAGDTEEVKRMLNELLGEEEAEKEAETGEKSVDEALNEVIKE